MPFLWTRTCEACGCMTPRVSHVCESCGHRARAPEADPLPAAQDDMHTGTQELWH